MDTLLRGACLLYGFLVAFFTCVAARATIEYFRTAKERDKWDRVDWFADRAMISILIVWPFVHCWLMT